MAFRFGTDERVRVITHPLRPAGTITARWTADEMADVHGENVYAVSGFISRQRESSLAPEGYDPITEEPLTGWRVAGAGEFRRTGPGVIESAGGPGLLWYTREEFDDFILLIDWCLATPEANSGVFVRIPALPDRGQAMDWTRAVDEGYEIQIDDRGIDHERAVMGSPQHLTGAVYALAPATARASEAPGRWNTFEIEARGERLAVKLNGVPVSALHGHRRRSGYLALQAHDRQSRVQFRNLQVHRLGARATPRLRPVVEFSEAWRAA